MHPFTDLETHVRHSVYRHFVETTRAPSTATIASVVGASEVEVAAALHRLAMLRALVLAPGSTQVWMAHPFSGVPTPYPVDVGTKTYFANCAWDAAGILSLVGDGRSQARCDDCGGEVEMAVGDQTMTGDGVVHFAVRPRDFWANVAFT